jgi:hypothetical protein
MIAVFSATTFLYRASVGVVANFALGERVIDLKKERTW